MKRRFFISAVAMLVSSMVMSIPAEDNKNKDVLDMTPGTGIKKGRERRSVAPICTIFDGVAVDLTFQAPSDDTSIYIVNDGYDLYFEANIMTNESSTMSVPTNQLPKGRYMLIVADETNCYYQELSVP